MHYVPIDQIIVAPDRQRREFTTSALETLANSIARRGLLHPVTLRNDSPQLVAGERRLRAIARLHAEGTQFTCNGTVVPSGTVPCLRLSEADALTLEETELEENVIRTDLTWQERANAEARLHGLRSQQAEQLGETQSLAETAKELGESAHKGNDIRDLRESILLNTFLDDPDVAGAQSRREALNIVKRKVASEFRSQLVAQHAAGPKSQHVALLGSCIDLLPRMALDTSLPRVDLIITDPPYGINAHKMTALSGSEAGTKHHYDDTLENAKAVWETIFRDGFALAAPDAVLYMFCDFRHWNTLLQLATCAGWTPHQRPLIWHKPTGGMLGDSSHWPRMHYETILLCMKGDMRTRGIASDVITMNGGDSALHAAAKPPALYVELLNRYALPGMHVLDPCAGSGPVFPAANALSLRATAIEIDETHFQTTLSRIDARE